MQDGDTNEKSLSWSLVLDAIPVIWSHTHGIIRYKRRFCHGINVNDPEDLRALKESISSLNESDKNFEDNSFSVELFVDK